MSTAITAITNATKAPVEPPPTATGNPNPTHPHTRPAGPPDTITLSSAAQAELAAEQLAQDTQQQLTVLADSGNIAAQQLLAQETADAAKQVTPLPTSLK
jgi:hypothetical protein